MAEAVGFGFQPVLGCGSSSHGSSLRDRRELHHLTQLAFPAVKWVTIALPQRVLWRSLRQSPGKRPLPFPDHYYCPGSDSPELPWLTPRGARCIGRIRAGVPFWLLASPGTLDLFLGLAQCRLWRHVGRPWRSVSAQWSDEGDPVLYRVIASGSEIFFSIRIFLSLVCLDDLHTMKRTFFQYVPSLTWGVS